MKITYTVFFLLFLFNTIFLSENRLDQLHLKNKILNQEITEAGRKRIIQNIKVNTFARLTKPLISFTDNSQSACCLLPCCYVTFQGEDKSMGNESELIKTFKNIKPTLTASFLTPL